MPNATSLRTGRGALAAGCLVLSFLAAPAAAQRPTLDGLQQQINTLTATVNAQVAVINNLANQLAVLQGNTVLALHQKLTYDAGTQTARFSGIDVRIDNGAPVGTINGKGNLIVGHNTARTGGRTVCSDGQFPDQASCLAAGKVWGHNHKSGSHNLVVGEQNSYSGYGGVVFGMFNAINREGATVLGGGDNIARGPSSSVSGGESNTASGGRSSVSGGSQNTASSESSSVSGGQFNTASGGRSSVSGGSANTASGETSGVSGGQFNTASGNSGSVSGGFVNRASGDWSVVSGGSQNTASGPGDSVSGGFSNTASGGSSSVSGGLNRSAPGVNDWAAGALFQDF